MAKKKSKKTSNAGGEGEAKETSGAPADGTHSIARLFTALQEKGAAWYGREREGIARIEGFQSALLALRDAQAAAAKGEEMEPENKQMGGVVLAGLAGNAEMDPWLAEDLFQQVQELSTGFEELLEEMYALQAQAREIGECV
ncbi:unnamed protein product [Phytophthora lilii]|uniref:Unnamed protein product n=1 Tax=Phytophthora lilii TaxID=2077276 RepID=A0A9W6XLK8_9STRA|nr:unnamed protein product [Phytophthora lilii]